MQLKENECKDGEQYAQNLIDFLQSIEQKYKQLESDSGAEIQSLKEEVRQLASQNRELDQNNEDLLDNLQQKNRDQMELINKNKVLMEQIQMFKQNEKLLQSQLDEFHTKNQTVSQEQGQVVETLKSEIIKYQEIIENLKN